MELKACPFCGGKAEIYEAEFEGKTFFTVGCENCNITTQGYETEEDAATAWNRRV